MQNDIPFNIPDSSPPPVDRDRRIWKTLGPAPKREFPSFAPKDQARELRKIKEALRGKIKNGKLDLKCSGDNLREKGILLEKKFNAPHDGSKNRKEEVDEIELEDDLSVGLLAPYFEEARMTAQNPGKLRGIPHDYDTVNKKYKPKNPSEPFSPNTWLPGVLIIDEIFKALLSDIDDLVKAANKAIKELKASDAGGKIKMDPAVMRLDRFISQFSDPKLVKVTDPIAAKYRPFINYRDDAPPPTYAKLVKVDDFIVGTIVYVGDWAAGYHSSGSAVHS